MKKLIILFLITLAGAAKAQTVGPLTNTNWNQGCYYNDSCPAITGGACGKAYTGCGATALAMTMKYYNYPASGRGNYSYTPPGFGVQSANFAATSYNWTGMPNTLASGNADVAQLMYHCGVALDMGYGAAGSYCSFDASSVLKEYFKYSLTCKTAMKFSYTNTEWENLIISELDAGRIVYLNGGSHFYLCDGYQTSPSLKFHMNFGWGGSYNGYYDLHNVIAAGSNFTPGGAIIGIQPMGTLEAGPDTVVIGSYAGAANYQINSLTNWTASSNQSWLTPVLLSGTDLYYNTSASASANSSYTVRYATITVTDGSISKTVVVKQTGITPSLYTSPSLLTYSSSSGSQNANITTDSSWTASSADSWISVSPNAGSGNGSVSITVTANPSASTRNGTVIVTRGNLSSTINIQQAGNGSFWCTPAMSTPNSIGVTNLTLNTINRNSSIDEGYINTGLNTTLKIDSSYTFTTTISGFVAPAVWIDWNIDGDFNDPNEAIVSPSGTWYPSSAGTKNQVFTVPSTASEGTTRMRVYIKKFGTGPVTSPCNTTDAGGDIEDYDIIVISHNHLTLTPSSLNFTSTGSTQNVSVDTDSSWTASTVQSWISVLPNSGSGNASSGITTTNNTGTVARSGLVTYTRGNISKFVSVFQSGEDTLLAVSPASMTFISTGGTQNLNVTANVSYALSTGAGWINLSNTSGSGTASFNVIVSANPLFTSRTDSVIVTSGTYREVIIINQDPSSAALSVTPDTLLYTSNGGLLTANITTASGWTASTGESWILVSPNSGSGNSVINVEADTNATGLQRTGYISISNGISTATIVVIQDANITTHMQENSEGIFFSVFPNPSTDFIFLRSNENISSIQLLDLSGKQVLTLENPGNSVSVQNITSGIYLLKAKIKGVTLLRKLIVK